jgi:hypothetical protein
MVNICRVRCAVASFLICVLAACAAACSSPAGEACESDADCPSGYECVSSGGVVFGGQLCALSAATGPDAAADSGADTATHRDGGADDSGTEDASDTADDSDSDRDSDGDDSGREDTNPPDVRVIDVAASSHDGNRPQESIDEDFSTRWSAEGQGEWIEYTLSDEAEVSYVEIAFHRGDERRSTFDVQLSTDGTTWVDALTGEQSSGTSLELETFSFNPGQARYVRLVGQGNDSPPAEGDGGWNSYLEVRIEDFPIDLSCTVNENECGSDGCGGQHPQCPAEQSCVSGSCQDDAVTNNDLTVIFSQDFSQSPVGDYSRTAWSQDWGLSESSWTDPCQDNCQDPQEWARARLTIEEENGNRFLRKVHDSFLNAGASGVQWWKGIGDHEELYLTFRVRFWGDDWEGPTYHGKLPGLCGSAGCPGGGNPPDHEDGFSTRYMFHDTSTLFFYLYHAAMPAQYGEKVSFNPYNNSPGQWRTVTQRVVLNTPGQANGIVEGFLDGELVAQKTDMDFRNANDQYISTLLFANFLGGSGEDPADYGDEPTNDFDDIMVYRYKDHVPGIKRGLEANDPGATIPLPTF